MKKQTMAIIAVIVILVIAMIGITVLMGNKTNNGDGSKIETVGQMKSMLETIYSNLDGQLPELETAEMDVSDGDAVTVYTGLQSNENIESLVVSEPLMNAQAYSVAIVKVKDGADIESMKQEMLDNIDTRKWICVSAEKLYITNNENVIFLVMASDEWATPVYEEFKKFVDNNIGKELEKTEQEEDIELPPEIIW